MNVTYRVEVITNNEIIESRDFDAVTASPVAIASADCAAGAWQRSQMEKDGVDETRLYRNGRLVKTWSDGETFRSKARIEKRINEMMKNDPSLYGKLLSREITHEQLTEMAR